MNKVKVDKIRWEISVPIFSNSIILKDLGIAVGIPFGLVAVFILIMTGGDISSNGAAYPLASIGILFLFAYFIIIILYGGRYAAGYVIHENGILNYMQKRQARRSRMVNTLTVIMGLASGKPSAAGAGLIAQTTHSVFVNWNSIRKVKVYPKSRSIVIKGGFAQKIALFCNEDNFQAVSDYILSRFNVNKE